MKIAYFSPLSPIKSGISKYSEINLLPYLKEYCEIDVFIDKGYKPENDYIKKKFTINSFEKFHSESYDLILYHMGNNPHHEYIYKTLLQKPGVVVLHDPFIGGLIWNLTISRGKPELYIEHLVYCLGEKGRKIAENAIASNNFPSFKYTLVNKIADSSIAIIVHSDFAKKIVSAECPNVLLKKINMPIPFINIEKRTTKESLGFSEDTLIIATFGYVAEHKRLHTVLKAFSSFAKKNSNSIFLIVGKFLEKNYQEQIDSLIKELKLSDKVIQTGFVENLVPYIQISDIIVQTRYPTAGETSIITLEMMEMGKPIITSNIGWFSELPDDTVIKINVNENEGDSIVSAFTRLATEKSFVEKLSSNAKMYVRKKHDPSKIAFEYFDFISQISKKEQTKFIHSLSHQLKNLGITHDDSYYLEHFSKTLQKIL